jgi:hypothetical protein
MNIQRVNALTTLLGESDAAMRKTMEYAIRVRDDVTKHNLLRRDKEWEDFLNLLIKKLVKSNEITLQFILALTDLNCDSPDLLEGHPDDCEREE